MGGFSLGYTLPQMTPPADSVAASSLALSPLLSRRATVALMFAVALAGAAGLVAWGPVGLVPHTHQFADSRWWLETPNGVNVWSHLPLLPIGVWGLWRVSLLPREEPLRWVWAAFFCCQMLATVGGMAYHWRPDELSFVWDQLPRSAACILFASAFLAERIDPRFGGPAFIGIALVAVGLGGLWWLGSLRAWGVGDLRPLWWLELCPMAIVATGAWNLQGHLLSRNDWMRSQLSFVIAQTVDWFDAPIYEWTGHWLSGHSIRHLALAACVGWVAYRLGGHRARAPKAEEPGRASRPERTLLVPAEDLADEIRPA